VCGAEMLGTRGISSEKMTPEASSVSHARSADMNMVMDGRRWRFHKMSSTGSLRCLIRR